MPASDPLKIRSLCRLGALFQAVRDIKHGFADEDIIDYVIDRWRYCSSEQAEAIIVLAHRGITAAEQLKQLAPHVAMPRAMVPKLPE